MALISPPPNVKSFSLPPLRHHHLPKSFRPRSPTVFSCIPTRYENVRILGYKYNGRRRAAMQIVMMSSAATTSVHPDSGEDSLGFGRILLSNVVVKRRNKVYLGRQWNSQDIATGAVVVAMHLLCLVAPFVFNWAAFWVAFGLYVASGLFGITLSFHRNLTHRSFKLPKWLEYIFAYCGVQALQGNPIDWVSTHRYHHQHCDSERDPHSPFEGFWYSHMSWMFDTDAIEKRCGERNNVGDLEKQPFYKFIQSTYILHPLALGILLYAVGGFPFVVWGMVKLVSFLFREALVLFNCPHANLQIQSVAVLALEPNKLSELNYMPVIV